MRNVMKLIPLVLLCQAFGQADSKLAAVQRACAAGALTPSECQSQLAKLKKPGNAAGAPTEGVPSAVAGHWSDPRGRYSIAIAPGWQIDASQQNLKVTKASSWAIFDTESHQAAPLEVAQSNAKEMSGMVQGWQVVQQQPFETPRHHASAGVTSFANVPTRSGVEPRVMTFAAQSAGSGNYVTLTASSLKENAPADQAEVMSMFNSIRFAGEK